MRVTQTEQLSPSLTSKWRSELWTHTAIDANTPYHNTNGMRPAIASINIANLKHNFQLLSDRCSDSTIMAVVKANAYGHGLHLVMPALFDAGCRHFAVTDAHEGKQARGLVPEAETITLLSGIFDAEDAKIAANERLTPVITEDRQAEMLHDAGFGGSLWIKINTGMQRLGADDPATLITRCEGYGFEVVGIMSHLACADMPEHPLNRVQADEFAQMHQSFAAHRKASLLNSAGIVSLPDSTFDFVRPGLALYGVEPIADEPIGLRPVMQLSGSVMQIHKVAKGESISYGASFCAPEDMQVAVVSLGYGDGLPRHLSNRGVAMCHDKRLPIVGRICMDFTLIDASNEALKIGDSIEFWGDQLLAHDVADLIDTIAYELFTGVDSRVLRQAV